MVPVMSDYKISRPGPIRLCKSRTRSSPVTKLVVPVRSGYAKVVPGQVRLQN